MNNIINSHRAIVLLADCTGGTLQGDPDMANEARQDPETGHGMVTPAMVKRKVRDELARHGHKIYVERGSCFERTDRDICSAVGIEPLGPTNEDPENATPATGGGKGKGKPANRRKITTEDARKFYTGLSNAYIDARLFGQTIAKLTGYGIYRGPVQVSMGRSIDPITIVRDCITRCAVTTEKDAASQSGDLRTMGRRSYVPYALYRFHIFVNPYDARNTLCTEKDYDLFLSLLPGLFDNDQSSARPSCAVQGLYELRFRPAGRNSGTEAINGERLLQSITVKRKSGATVARSFTDYQVTIPTTMHHSDLYDFRTIVGSDALDVAAE